MHEYAGLTESAALWYENLSGALSAAGFVKNRYEMCVYNKRDKKGVQCTVAIHVDDLVISSAEKDMIDSLSEHLRNRYGKITRADGPVVNYLGMVFDLTVSAEAKMTMKGYVEDTIAYAGVTGTARSPATDGLFEIQEGAALAEEKLRVWFHSVVAKLSYLAKRTKPECLAAIAFLATRVTKCTEDDIEKLKRVLRYVAGTRDNGVVFRPGVLGICVRVYIDAAYGVHVDGKSHTGSCVVIGDVGSVHCKSSKQGIVTKSSTEAELVALSDSSNRGLYLRNFLKDQGCKMEPAVRYQENMSCMALIDRGRSGAERTRHIGIKYFWLSERVFRGEAVVEQKGRK